MKSKFYFLGLLVLSSVIMVSCSSSDDIQLAKIQVILIDAPADYDAVFVDIQDVLINTTNEDGNWQSLNKSEPGIYDLLELTNGTELFLGEIELPEGELNQIRLILGENNTLIIDQAEINLSTPSAQQSGLKLNIQTTITAGVTYKLIIDFDAAKSVVKAGQSGKYNLKPVLRAQMEAQTGAIEGVVNPANIKSVIYAVKGTDTISTFPDEFGEFLLRALEAGIYSVVASPDTTGGYTNITLENILVNTGTVTKLDSIHFKN
jgi:hypothetical protein